MKFQYHFRKQILYLFHTLIIKSNLLFDLYIAIRDYLPLINTTIISTIPSPCLHFYLPPHYTNHFNSPFQSQSIHIFVQLKYSD